jgi:hypothetical protein
MVISTSVGLSSGAVGMRDSLARDAAGAGVPPAPAGAVQILVR